MRLCSLVKYQARMQKEEEEMDAPQRVNRASARLGLRSLCSQLSSLRRVSLSHPLQLRRMLTLPQVLISFECWMLEYAFLGVKYGNLTWHSWGG